MDRLTQAPVEWLNEGPGRMSHRRQQRERAIRLCRDVHAGTLHMRDRADVYLPRFPKEDLTQYERRVDASVLFNAYKRTVGGLVGMVLRKPLAPTEPPSDAEDAVLADVDRSGRDLATFASDLFADAWIDGHAIIFVDKPPVPEGATADEVRGVRPYFVIVRADDVLGFATDRRAGTDVVVSLRWREFAVQKDPEDRFLEKLVPRVREYRLTTDGEGHQRVEWELWELRAVRNERRWTSTGTGMLGSQMDEIPIGVAYTGRRATLDSEPPLLDLAAENVRHYQKLSDKDNAEHIACVPILAIVGADQEKIENFSVGPTVGLQLGEGGDAKYVETTGAGAEAARDSLKDSEHRMALLGLSMLHSESRAAETATSKRIDKSESDSQLSVAAASLERALNRAFALYAKWEGTEPITVSVSRDFENLLLDAQMVQVLADLVPTKISLDTFWERMREGEVLPDSFDPELERERIESGDTQTLAALRRLVGRGRGRDGDEDDG